MMQQFHFEEHPHRTESRDSVIFPLMFIAAPFTIAKGTDNPTTCPLTDEQTHDIRSIHTMEYYSALKKE